jgi:hypothetical protein
MSLCFSKHHTRKTYGGKWYSSTFFMAALDGVVSLTHQASYLRKRSLLVPIRWEAGWASELVWRGKSPTSAGIWIPIAWLSCPKTGGCTGWAIAGSYLPVCSIFVLPVPYTVVFLFFLILPNLSVSKLQGLIFFKLVWLLMIWILHLPNVSSPPLKQRGYFVFAHEERGKKCDIIQWFFG